MGYNAAARAGNFGLWAARQPHIRQASNTAYFPSVWSNAAKATIASVGNMLTASSGVWIGPSLTIQRQWLRNDATISGATNNSYSVVAADSGKTVGCKILATNKYSENYLLAATLPVLA